MIDCSNWPRQTGRLNPGLNKPIALSRPPRDERVRASIAIALWPYCLCLDFGPKRKRQVAARNCVDTDGGDFGGSGDSCGCHYNHLHRPSAFVLRSTPLASLRRRHDQTPAAQCGRRQLARRYIRRRYRRIWWRCFPPSHDHHRKKVERTAGYLKQHHNRCPIFFRFVSRYFRLCSPGSTRIGTSSTTVSPYPSIP